jgi:hypothetical protein
LRPSTGGNTPFEIRRSASSADPTELDSSPSASSRSGGDVEVRQHLAVDRPREPAPLGVARNDQTSTRGLHGCGVLDQLPRPLLEAANSRALRNGRAAWTARSSSSRDSAARSVRPAGSSTVIVPSSSPDA